MFKLWHAVAAVLLSTSLLFAQAPAPAQTPMTTLRANSRLVVVDVVVTDKDDQIIKGLQQSDFTVFEDGKPQRIVGFEEHSIANTTSTPLAPLPKLPPDVFTNATQVPSDAPINIVLIDVLNTGFLDQAYGRNQLIKFLKSLPQKQRVAVFVLGGELRMVQGFTGDSDRLVKAATEFKPELSLTRSPELDALRFRNELPTNSPLFAAALYQVLADESELRTTYGVQATILAFKQIARASSAYPGRKNLIWLSSGFPLTLTPDSLPRGAAFAPMKAGATRFDNEVHAVSHLLAANKIAVYPVDIRGLATTVPEADVRIGARDTTSFHALTDFNENLLAATQSTMREIAHETGGRAFYNKNDLDIAMRRSVELGSAYYTIAYAPTNQKWDGNYRKIVMKTEQRGLHLAHRRGYYAFTEDTPVERRLLQRDIQLAMERLAPLSTDIVFLAGAQRQSNGTVQIDYRFEGRRLRLRDGENRAVAAKYVFAVVGWDGKGKVAGQTNEAWELPGDAESIAKIEAQGWTHSQRVKLPPSATQIRVAIQDQTTGKIGTVDVPLPLPPS